MKVYIVTCAEEPNDPIKLVTLDYLEAYQMIIDEGYQVEYDSGERWWDIHSWELGADPVAVTKLSALYTPEELRQYKKNPAFNTMMRLANIDVSKSHRITVEELL